MLCQRRQTRVIAHLVRWASSGVLGAIALLDGRRGMKGSSGPTWYDRCMYVANSNISRHNSGGSAGSNVLSGLRLERAIGASRELQRACQTRATFHHCVHYQLNGNRKCRTMERTASMTVIVQELQEARSNRRAVTIDGPDARRGVTSAKADDHCSRLGNLLASRLSLRLGIPTFFP